MIFAMPLPARQREIVRSVKFPGLHGAPLVRILAIVFFRRIRDWSDKLGGLPTGG
jgi:hypothetical protein